MASAMVMVLTFWGQIAPVLSSWPDAVPPRGKEETLPLNESEDSPESPEEAVPEDTQETPAADPAQDLPDAAEDLSPDSDSPTFLRPQNGCPGDFEPLVSRLLQDLPTYTELVAGRNLELRTNRPSPFGTVITASQPDYEPIELAKNPYGSGDTATVRQIFFTTLERQYWQGQAISLQNYHWLFLAEADSGWYLSQIYSSLGGYPATPLDAPTPPGETSGGIIGQAVTLWLRDCRAGAVFPPDSSPRGR